VNNLFIKRLWSSIALVALLLALLVLVLQDFGGGIPDLPAFQERPRPAREVIPVSNIEQLFSSASVAGMLPLTRTSSLVYTAHFQPPPAAPKPEPPPPPTTRNVDLLYHGFYTTGDGGKRAFVDVAGELFVRAEGEDLINGYQLREIGFRSLTLANAAGETIILNFNSKKELQLPAR
jgi:hypothetical protein